MSKVYNPNGADKKTAAEGGTGLNLSQALELSGKIVRSFHHHKHKTGPHPGFDKKPAGGPITASLSGKADNEVSRAVAHATEGAGSLNKGEATYLVTHVAHLLLGGEEDKD